MPRCYRLLLPLLLSTIYISHNDDKLLFCRVFVRLALNTHTHHAIISDEFQENFTFTVANAPLGSIKNNKFLSESEKPNFLSLKSLFSSLFLLCLFVSNELKISVVELKALFLEKKFLRGFYREMFI